MASTLSRLATVTAVAILPFTDAALGQGVPAGANALGGAAAASIHSQRQNRDKEEEEQARKLSENDIQDIVATHPQGDRYRAILHGEITTVADVPTLNACKNVASDSLRKVTCITPEGDTEKFTCANDYYRRPHGKKSVFNEVNERKSVGQYNERISMSKEIESLELGAQNGLAFIHAVYDLGVSGDKGDWFSTNTEYTTHYIKFCNFPFEAPANE